MRSGRVGWFAAVAMSAMIGCGVVYAAIAFVLGVVRPDLPYPTAARLVSVNAEERFDVAVADDIAGMLRGRPDVFDRVVIYKDNFGVRLEGDPSPRTTALAGSHDVLERGRRRVAGSPVRSPAV